ncbi:MAG: hypothetical protein HZA54_19570 [Planctomycetes bacterium]|nr:hypothetical protein [Planctomycetota bacterium]
MFRVSRSLRRLALLPLWLLVMLPCAAQDEPDEGAKRVIQQVAGAWQGESVAGVLSAFPTAEEGKVYLGLGSAAGTFSRDQAAGVLRNYFAETTVEGVRLLKWTGRSGAKFDYRYRDASGNSVSGMLLIEVQVVNRRWVLRSVMVN